MDPAEDYAIVFSGGGALAAWEVGCLKAVLAHHKERPPTIVTGASAGAINAAGLCAGISAADLENLWSNITESDVFQVRPYRGALARILWDTMLGEPFLQSVKKQLSQRKSVFDTTPLRRTLEGILHDKEHDFLVNKMAFAISLTLLNEGRTEFFYKTAHGEELPSTATEGRHAQAWKRVLGLEHLLQALMGTSALPGLFPPFESRFDGGVLMNQPIAPAIGLGAMNLYVFIPSTEAFLVTEDLLSISSSVMSTWLSVSLVAQIERIRLRNEIRRLTGDRPFRVCVVRPGRNLGENPGVGLLSFGKLVKQLVEMGEESATKRIVRFDYNNPATWF